MNDDPTQDHEFKQFYNDLDHQLKLYLDDTPCLNVPTLVSFAMQQSELTGEQVTHCRSCDKCRQQLRRFQNVMGQQSTRPIPTDIHPKSQMDLDVAFGDANDGAPKWRNQFDP